MKKQWSDVAGFPILSSEEEGPLAYLNGVFMNPENAQIIGFLVGYTRVLVSVDIERWSRDYLKISDADCLGPVMDILRIRDYGLKRSFLNAKRVLSKSGKRLGRVRDFTFETSTDSLLTFEVSKRFLWWEWGKFIFSAKDIQEVTEKAIRLNVEREDSVKEKNAVPALAG